MNIWASSRISYVNICKSNGILDVSFRNSSLWKRRAVTCKSLRFFETKKHPLPKLTEIKQTWLETCTPQTHPRTFHLNMGTPTKKGEKKRPLGVSQHFLAEQKSFVFFEGVYKSLRIFAASPRVTLPTPRWLDIRIAFSVMSVPPRPGWIGWWGVEGVEVKGKQKPGWSQKFGVVQF